MKGYFALQRKRAFKLLPFILSVCLAVLIALGVGVFLFFNQNANNQKYQKFKVAVTGDWDNAYTKLGLAALQQFDDTRFSIEITTMTREEAQKALQRGGIAAYVVFPDGFIERALKGDVDQVTYVTAPGNQTVASVFKNEMTRHITDMMIASQKGVYGVSDAIKQQDAAAPTGEHMDNLSLEMVTLILNRSEVYTVEELGFSTGVSMKEYYLCAVTVFFLLLLGVCFVTVYVKNHTPLHTLLVSKGVGCLQQILAEYLAYLSVLVIPAALIFVPVTAMGLLFPQVSSLFEEVSLSFLGLGLAVTAMAGAFHLMTFTLSGNVITAVLLSFLGCIGQGYICGCFYPLHALPNSLQGLANYLPCGVARQLLESSVGGDAFWIPLLKTLGFTLLFLGITLGVRMAKVKNKRG